MMTSRFDTFIERILSHEGGYINHPSDPGGETNWGITKAVAQENGYTGSMRNMSRARAIGIYKRKYWDAVNGELLPDPLAFQVLDASVNHGPKRAIKWLQESLGITSDGVWGLVTERAVFAASDDLGVVIQKALLFCRIRQKFYTDLATFKDFGKGWTRRMADNMFYLAEDM